MSGEKTFQIAIAMGAMAPKLAKQLKQAGLRFDKSAIEHIQQDSDALARLSIRGYLNDSVRDAIRRRIVKAVEAELQAGIRN